MSYEAILGTISLKGEHHELQSDMVLPDMHGDVDGEDEDRV